MSLAERATGARQRWYKRSVERRFGEDLESWEPAPGTERGTEVGGGAHVSVDDDSGKPKIDVRLGLKHQEPQVTVELECAVLFEFANDPEDLPHDEVELFINEVGVDYVLGYGRAALTDIVRSVGLPALMLPTTVGPGLAQGIAGTFEVSD
ncbi:hypothetical protein [Nocardia sp. BMG51109]|uniref:hypothetical protein n=1 Tax=Nocardia sp. BMG51109 TaxID=1056816 RepID=UPI00046641B3|nr:hypothetical protein [Nocardia sp. BMG51109]